MANDGAIGGAVSGAATGAAAGPWGALAGAVIGGAMGMQSDKALAKAADAQREGALFGFQQTSKGNQRADKLQQPYRQGGKEAQNELMYQLGLGDPSGYAKTQNYFNDDQFKQFALTQAEKTIRDSRLNAKDKGKTDRLVQNRLAELSAKIDKEGAWNVYQQRLASGGNVNGDFFMKRDANGGGGADNGYGSLMKDFTNADFIKDPGYQFRMDEGKKAVEGSAAARGGLLSGAALKAMDRYSQGYASNEFSNAFNRDTTNKNNRFQRLSGVVDTGARAAGITGGIAQNQGQQAAQFGSTMGDITASKALAGNNMRQSGYESAGNTLMDMYSLNKMYPSNAPQSSGTRKTF
jgi:hypothetical protein